MKDPYNLAITIEPDMIAEHIALFIADELNQNGIDVETSRQLLVEAGLLMEINMKGGDLGSKLLTIGDMQIAISVSK